MTEWKEWMTERGSSVLFAKTVPKTKCDSSATSKGWPAAGATISIARPRTWNKSLAKSACSAPKPDLPTKHRQPPLSQGLLGQAPQAARLALRGQTLIIDPIESYGLDQDLLCLPTYLPRDGEPPDANLRSGRHGCSPPQPPIFGFREP
jgi:hypothetical protein